MSNLGYPTNNNWASDATAIGSLTVGEMISSAEQLRNTRTMQAILDRGGDLKIVVPGIYLFDVTSAPLTLSSNTSLYVGAGVTLKVANSSPSALFTNSAARSTGVAVTGANANYALGPDANNFVAVISNMTAANAARFPVNSWVSVEVFGHAAGGAAGTALASRGYRGVRRVVEQTINGNSSSIKYLIDPVFPGSGGNNLTMFPANENIKVCGPGTINGNGALANQTFNTGDPRGIVMWWRHAQNVVIQDLNFLRGVTWCIGSNYVRDYTVSGTTFNLTNTPIFAAIDFVHLSGNHQNVLITDIKGASADNVIGMTIDCTDATAGAPGFPTYNFPYQSPGDMSGITIRNCQGEAISEDGSFGIIGIYGPAAYWYKDIIIDGVRGCGSSVVQLSTYATTNQNLLNIDKIAISKVFGFVGGSTIELTGGVMNIGDMLIVDSYNAREDIPFYRAFDAATGTIRNLSFRNCTFFPYAGAAFSRSAPMIRLGGPNVNTLNVSGMETIVQDANVRMIAADGPGNIPKVGIQNCSATGSGTGAGLAAVWADTGAGTAAAPVYNNCTSNGSAL